MADPHPGSSASISRPSGMANDAPLASYRVHTLLHLRNFDGAHFINQRPSWLTAHASDPGWVVVRRGIQQSGLITAGVRGRLRSDRCAVDVPTANVIDAVQPFQLARSERWIGHPRGALIPALRALPDVVSLIAAHIPSATWGPTGSVGLELASGAAWTTPASDLDLMLRVDEPLPLPVATSLADAFGHLRAKVDMVLETPNGGIALADYARRTPPWLLRTSLGPRLTQAPWEAHNPDPGI